MNALSTLVRHLWMWLMFVPLVVFATVIGGLITIPVSTLGGRRWANMHVARNWARLLAWASFTRVEIQGREHIRPGQSYVVVANHQSQFDIPVVYGFTGLDMIWVMKAELRRIPIVGIGCVALGHILIDRADPDKAHDTINRAVARLPGETGILFFPEGTRTRTGRLLPFKKGAFRVAIDRHLPVLPITVTGTAAVLPPGTIQVRPGRRVGMIIHPPVEIGDMTMNDIAALREQSRRAIASGLEPGAACT